MHGQPPGRVVQTNMADGGGRDRILQRILRECRAPDLFDVLTRRLSLTDLQSLLLLAYKQRVASVRPHDVLSQYRSNRFVRPTPVTPADFIDLDRLAFSLLPDGFQTVELSPVAPLGTCTALAPLDQNNVLTTIRNTEVVSDATNVLALECAVRRGDASASSEQTKLCASHRLLRAQSFSGPASFAHFRLLALCTAGRNQGSLDLELRAAREHIDFFMRLLRASEQLGFRTHGLRVMLIPFSAGHLTAVRTELRDVLLRQYPNVSVDLDVNADMGKGYYQNFRYQIHATNGQEELLLVDGGLTPWTKVLLSNRKEFLLTSGMGTERFVACFRGR